MSDTKKTDTDEEYDGLWVCALVECDICGHVHVSVHPIVCERLECPGCGYMMAAPPVDETEEPDS